MNQKAKEKLLELKDAISRDPRFLAMESANKEIETSEKVKKLAKEKDIAADRYEDALSHSPDEVEERRIALHKAKLALDGDELVKKYTENYVVCRDIMMQIDDIVFGSFRNEGK